MRSEAEVTKTNNVKMKLGIRRRTTHTQNNTQKGWAPEGKKAVEYPNTRTP